MRSIPLLIVILLSLVSTGSTQELPNKIRGYKVENIPLKLNSPIAESEMPFEETDLYLQLSDHRVSMRGLLSVSIEFWADILSTKRSGSIDMVTFHDVRVNGIALDVDEYAVPLTLKKGSVLSLTKPMVAKLNLIGAAKGALSELTDSRPKWQVTGKALVFGKFKKLGFTFKRVVPIKFDLTIANPLQ